MYINPIVPFCTAINFKNILSQDLFPRENTFFENNLFYGVSTLVFSLRMNKVF